MTKYLATTAAFMAAVSFLFSAFSQAQVTVEDLNVPSRYPGDASNYPVRGNSQAAAAPSLEQFYKQIQALQDEVQSLRGLVEEQGYELRKLKQQQADDYADVDRRLSVLLQSGSAKPRLPASLPRPEADAAVSAAAQISTLPSRDPAAENSASLGDSGLAEEADELGLYRSGIDAVLKQRDYDKGLGLFQDYLKQFPQGVYVANAKYWLGQIHLQQNNLPQAEEWFKAVVTQHGNHQKAPEAQFKLGKVLHLQGRANEAKAELQAVVKGGSPAASLAEDYLATYLR